MADDKRLPAACEQTLGLRSVRLVAVRECSRIFRGESDAGELAIKQCLDPVSGLPDVMAATLEHQSLDRLLQASRALGARQLAPQPMRLLEQFAVYAMTWQAGVPLTQVLMSRGTSAQACGRAAGKWLGEFHALRKLPERQCDFRSGLVVAERLRNPVRGDRLMDQAARLLAHTVSRAESISMPSSWIHGDFKSDNLLWADGQTIALDILLRYENAVIYDLVPFLVHIDLLRWGPRGLLNWRRLTQASEAFLEAYGPSVSTWRLPIAWLRTQMLWQRACNLAVADDSLRGRVRRATVRRALSGALRALARA